MVWLKEQQAKDSKSLCFFLSLGLSVLEFQLKAHEGFIADVLWWIERFLLYICETHGLLSDKDVEEQSDNGPHGEVPERAIDIQRRINHELESERDYRQVDELGAGSEPWSSIDTDLRNIEPGDTALGQLEVSNESDDHAEW